jgi:hypothetical protein
MAQNQELQFKTLTMKDSMPAAHHSHTFRTGSPLVHKEGRTASSTSITSAPQASSTAPVPPEAKRSSSTQSLTPKIVIDKVEKSDKAEAAAKRTNLLEEPQADGKQKLVLVA